MSTLIRQQVKQIIAEQALIDFSDVNDGATLESLGIDSITLVESVFAIEEAFDIQVPFNANTKADPDFDTSSVASLVDAVTKLIAAKKAA